MCNKKQLNELIEMLRVRGVKGSDDDDIQMWYNGYSAALDDVIFSLEELADSPDQDS